MSDPLLLIQQSLKAPKGQTNAFGKYKYRSCEDILEALKKPLKEASCYVVLSDEPIMVGDRFYIKATAQLKQNGIIIEQATAVAQEPADKKGMDLSQISGAASSYARKYALNGLFAIDDTKDADTNEHANQVNAAQGESGDRVKAHNEALRNNYESVMAVKAALADDNFDTAAEAFSEIPESDRQALALATTKGGIYTIEEAKKFRDDRWSEARKRYIQQQNEV